MSADWIDLQQTVDRRESADYRKRRQELQQAEIALMRQREQVAEMRRALPTGAVIKQDYIFQEGPADLAAGDKPVREVRLSQLFTAPKRSLVLYHFMYGKGQKKRVRCARCGSTGLMVWPIIWLRMSISRSLPPPISRPCASMVAGAVDITCGS